MTNYNGNAANATGSTVTISIPQDGDSFTAANDNARTSFLADWMQRLANIVLVIASTAWNWTAAQTWAALATFNGGLTSTGATALSGGTTITNACSIPAGATIATPTLTNATLQNAWANSSGTGTGPLRYWKDQMGVVHLSGGVNGGSATTNTIATLPVGFRPSGSLGGPGSQVLLPFCFNGTLAHIIAIGTDGTIVSNTSDRTSGDDLVLDGVAFPTF